MQHYDRIIRDDRRSQTFRVPQFRLPNPVGQPESKLEYSMPQSSPALRLEIDSLEHALTISPIAQTEIAPKAVWIDSTYTLGSGKNSGIERVVRNLCRHGERFHAGNRARVAATVVIDGRFYRVDKSIASAFQTITQAEGNILASLPRVYKLLATGLCAAIPSRRLRKWLLPQPGHLGAFKLPHRLLRQLLHKRIGSRGKPVNVSCGDWLVMPDAYWACQDVWPAVRQARQAGAFVVCVIYDIIPITHAEFVGEHRRQRALDYLKQVATHADLILTISEAVSREVASILPRVMEGREYCQDIRAFRLGAEISLSKAEPRKELQHIFGSQTEANPCLTVAAFDPRKNHQYLLDAFERLWQVLPDEKLCLVGRVGARCEELVDRLRTHPRYRKELFMFHDLSDSELAFCYRQSKCVIFPSIVEGFGLPIVESLWHGKKTFASDTPIHREVGGDDCEYFELADPQRLANMLIEWRQDAYAAQATHDSQRLLTWAQSVDQFASACRSSYQEWLARRNRQSTDSDRRAA